MSDHSSSKQPSAAARRRLTLAVTGACAIGLITAAAANQGHAGARPSTLTLTARIDPSAARSIDTAPTGPSAGDIFVYSATIRHGRRVIGRLEGTTTGADPKYQGDVSTQYWVLRNGTIAVIGGGQTGAPGVGRPDSRIYDAIVGGTGRYTGAHGWVSGDDLDDTTIQRTFHFTR
jgi:hypothetical protein